MSVKVQELNINTVLLIFQLLAVGIGGGVMYNQVYQNKEDISEIRKEQRNSISGINQLLVEMGQLKERINHIDSKIK